MISMHYLHNSKYYEEGKKIVAFSAGINVQAQEEPDQRTGGEQGCVPARFAPHLTATPIQVLHRTPAQVCGAGGGVHLPSLPAKLPGQLVRGKDRVAVHLCTGLMPFGDDGLPLGWPT